MLMLLEDLANPDPFDLDFYGPAAGLDELLASHKSDQTPNLAATASPSAAGQQKDLSEAPDKSPEREGPQSGPEPGISGTSDDSNDDDDPTDLNRTKRMLANRQSARQSRLRKMRRISLLDQMVKSLQLSIAELEPRLSRLQGKHLRLQADNASYQKELAALVSESSCKQSLNKALHDEVCCISRKAISAGAARQSQHMSAHPGLASSCTVPCMPAASVPNSQPGCFLMPAQPSLAGQAPLVVPSAQCPPQAVLDPLLGSFTPADMCCKPVQDVAPGAFLSAAPASIKPTMRYGYAANQPAFMYARNASLPSVSMLRHYAPQLSLPEGLKA